MVTIARPFITLLIFHSLLFFSLFSGLNKLSNLSSSSFSLDAHKHTHTQTHPHRQINTEIHAQKKKKKKKKNTEIHKHTHTQTNPNGQTTKRQVGAYRNDRCLTGTIRARGSCLIGARGSHLIGARGYRSCLIDACGLELGRSVLA